MLLRMTVIASDSCFFFYFLQEGFKVSNDLRVDQSFEELEDMFEPDEEFSFDAVLQLQEMNESTN